MRKIYLALLLLTTGMLFAGKSYAQPSITYSAVAPSCAGSSVVVNGVTIADGAGVPTTGALQPRIYVRKNSGAWFSAQGTLASGSGTSGTWDFSLSAATLGGLVAGNTVSYFIIAQNNSSAIASSPAAGLVATDVNTVTTFPTTPNAYTVSSVPSLAALTSSPTTTCIGFPFTLNSGAVAGVGTLISYNWSGPDGYATTGTTPSAVITPTTTAATGIYTLNVTYPGNGCSSVTRNVSVTVNGSLPAITGATTVCAGSTTTFGIATSGGSWSSSNTGVATINASNGFTSGVSAGTTTISYAVGACVSTTVLTVNPIPLPITGATGVCIGDVTTLANTTTGGTWASSNGAVATIGAGTGIVTGVANGTTLISYTLSTGCRRTTIATVYSFPSVISGSLLVCEGSSISLVSTPTGGTWVSTTPAVATISSTGMVTGIAAGTSTISYTLPSGCMRVADVTVNPIPAAIAGPGTVCSGTTITLTNATAGGTWTSSIPTVATINSTTGVVTGVGTGATNISYTLGTGCRTTVAITSNTTPGAIVGVTSICNGTTTTLGNTSTGGTWSSSDGAVAGITTGTGFLTSVAAGTSVITYTLPTACFRTTVFTVNPSPAAIAGTPIVCVGSSITLTNTEPGGTWISSNTSFASVGSLSGVVTGLSSGNVTIAYRLANSCQSTVVLTINQIPAAITGTAVVCEGLTTNLTTATSFGVWSSTDGAVATISPIGVVTGVSGGTSTISYTVATGCARTRVVTVNSSPAAIAGNVPTCPGLTLALSSASVGGTWTSGNTSVATINTSTGLLTAVAAGTAEITYRLPTTCLSTAVITVNALPAVITGTPNLCLGNISTLTSADPGGAWSSSNPAVASIDAFGSVTGVALGTSIITYTLPTGCRRTLSVTVNTVPLPVSGTDNVCVGSTTNLSSSPSGGVWSSANIALATVNSSSGVVSGVSSGVVAISYTIGNGCSAVADVTVNALPAPITGSALVCVDATTALSTLTPGGAWSSANTAIATVDPAGVATGVLAGNVIISYTLPTGCAITTLLTVNPLPGTITGPNSVCTGLNIALASLPYTGTWSSSDVVVAPVSPAGIVTGASVGTATIVNTFATGCSRSVVVTVNASPAPITGTLVVCGGFTTLLSSATPGGVWSAPAASVLTINSATGLATGVSSGISQVSYTMVSGCRATAVVTVNNTPPLISGPFSVCVGGLITLTNAGGTWTSSNPGVATITLASGLVNGVTAGTTSITYTNGQGCISTREITVNALPAPITGVLSVCLGGNTTLSNATPGGVWSKSAATGNVTILAYSGLATGTLAGTATITYSLITGCNTSAVITVNPLPAAIAGVPNICNGNTTIYSTSTTGGAWSSENPFVATIDGAGLITSVSAGTTRITYTTPDGCITNKSLTVNPLPAPIGGAATVCVGSTAIMTSATPGGGWSSNNIAIATINSTTGIVTGVSAGVVDITYTLNTFCFVTTQLTVNASPTPITGTAVACVGGTSLLANASVGTWSSGSIGVATIDAGGLVTAVGPGQSTISYTNADGCKATVIFTVQPIPNPIAGTAIICTGLSTTMSTLPGGGAWSSSNPLIATASAGVVTGLTPGTALISYTLATGCTRTITVTINESPALSTGVASTCIGGTSTLSNAIPGGAWTSANTAVATVGVASGVVTGLVAGSVNITYTLPSGCRTVTNFVVGATPAVIAGTASVCEGLSTTLTNATPGGTWSSSSLGTATVGSASGIVTGVAAGTTTISYTVLSSGCFRTRTITVNPVPSPILGTASVCVGQTTGLSSATLGGTWTSSNATLAAVNTTTGVVTGVATGVADITYKLSTGCIITTPVTVNLLPAAIVGATNVCIGANTVFTSSTPGGAWSSSNPSIASIGTNGVITGVSNGGANITYMLGTGCFVTRPITVLGLPSPIAGTLAICEGSTSALSSLTPGGTWSSSNTFVATIGLTSGFVNALFPGTTTIVYTLPTGCTATATLTVNAAPTAIAGVANICLGSSSTLSSLTPGGSWSTSNPVVAIVGASTGTVTGLSLGTARITYILGTGCRTTLTVTVSNVPANIVGVPSVCVGGTTNLTNATAGGTWSSTDNSIATVGTSGVVNGIIAGVVTISYTLPSGCAKTLSVTVNPVPAPIAEVAALCIANNMTLTSATPGGIWLSSSSTIATVGVTSGLLTGVNAGTSIITYQLSTGCQTFTIATVNPLPAPIVGLTNICAGTVTTFTNAVTGGIWSSDNIAIATIDPSTGVLTGTGLGIGTIRYTLTGGCEALITVTVTPAPPAIAGDLEVCSGETSLLTNDVAGGSWTSGTPAVATIDLGSGLVTALTAGSTEVTYTLGVGCRVTASFVVNPAPSVITGPTEVCMGRSVALYNAVAGGTWTSSDVSVASVDGVTGIVTGIANNTVTITYQLPGGCAATFDMTVNATPPPIGGADSVCLGLTTLLTNGSPFSGIWTSTNPSVAPIDLFTGVVTGVAVGTSTISFTILGTGCYRETIVTVNPTPDAITGVTNVCVASFTTLSTTSIGGTWSSSDMSVAVVGSGTGIVTGLSAGGTIITYTMPTGCIATTLVVVNPLPDNIAGTTEICVGSSTILTDATPFGTWTSSNPAVATIGATSGSVAGISPGLSIISYTLLATGCYATQQITVNPVPPVISGNPNLCLGSSSFLTNPASGGTWSSSNPAVATIDAFGNVTSVSTGNTTVTYTLTSACYTTILITVEPNLNPITGPSNVCEGSDITLANDYAGGIWSSSDLGRATVDAATGVVSGISAGSATIQYETPLAGCSITKTITIDPLPSAITGTASACEGATSALANLTSGGTWSSTDVAIATVDAAGVVTAVSANTVIISYTIGTGCAATVEFTVNPLPDAGTISGLAEICLNETATLASTEADGIWSSNNPDVFVVDTVAGIIRGDSVGTAVITYTHTNVCGVATATFNVLVKPLPDAGILSGATGLCINYTSTLSSSVSGGVWSSSNTAIATVNPVGVATGIAEGTATISYSLTTSCGTDVSTVVVTVHSLAPNTKISVHPDSVLCANSLFQNFGAEKAPPAGFNYLWSATNAEVFATSADRQNAIVNFHNAGIAVVKLITQITSTGCFATDSFTVLVNADSAYMPEVKYYGNELICTDNSATSYQWGYDDANTFDSTIIPGAIMQSFYLPVPDFGGKRYWVIAERGGCFSKVYYNKPTDITPAITGMVDVRLFPNPADSRLNMEVTGLGINDEISIRLIDMMGREIETAQLVNGKGSINVANLSSGIYSVMFISNGNKVASKTFVKN